MQECREGGYEDDLKQRGADHNLGWHPEKVDHCGHHDEAASDPHDCGKDANHEADEDWWNDRDIEAGHPEPHLERQSVNPIVVLAAGWGRVALGLADGSEALDEHQPTDDAEEYDVAKLDQQIDLSEGFEVVEQEHAECCAYEPSYQKDNAHLEVNRAPFEVGKNAGEGRGNDLICFGGHGDGRGDADKKQKRRHEEAAANTKHTRKHTHDSAKPKEQKGVHGNFGDRQVDLHGFTLREQKELCNM